MGNLLRAGSLNRTYTMVALTGVIILILILRGYYDGKHLNELHAPQLAAVREARLEAAAAQQQVSHLLNEPVSSASQNVFIYLDQSLWHLQSLYEPKEPWIPKLTPSDDNIIGEGIVRLNQLLDEIKLFFNQQLGKPATQQDLASILKKNDLLFTEFWHQLDKIEADVLQSMSRDRIMFQLSHFALILIGVAVTLVVILTIRRYERQSYDDLKAIQAVNLE